MFSAEKRKLLAILKDQSRYHIPAYQRAYNWKPTNAEELLEDLRSAVAAKPAGQLFLGNFILQRQDDNAVLDVVDGQQRLTSIMLLLIACRDRARELDDLQLAQEIQSQIGFTDAATAQTLGTRLIASTSVRQYFEHMAQFEWAGADKKLSEHMRLQKRKLWPVYQTFRKGVESYTKDQLSSLLRAIHEALVIVIEIDDVLDALSIFERTNARGMDLEVSDLLKNYLFQQGIADVEARWQAIQKEAGSELIRVLRYFYISKFGLVKKADLYKSLKNLSAEQGAAEMTAELEDFASFFRVIQSGNVASLREWATKFGLPALGGHQNRSEALFSSIQALRWFGQTQHIPLLYAALVRARAESININPRTPAEAVVRLGVVLERFHFQNNQICQRIGNEVERLYADYAAKFSADKSVVDQVDAIITELRKKRASQEEFVANFVALGYSEPVTLYYIFDRLTNFNWQTKKPLDSGQRLVVFDPDSTLTSRNWTIEHFYPQKAGVEVDQATQEAINNVGNLLLLYYKVNSTLGNSLPVEKVERLRGPLKAAVQNVDYVMRFLDKYEDKAATWGAEAINLRAKEMALEAYDIVWAF